MRSGYVSRSCSGRCNPQRIRPTSSKRPIQAERVEVTGNTPGCCETDTPPPQRCNWSRRPYRVTGLGASGASFSVTSIYVPHGSVRNAIFVRVFGTARDGLTLTGEATEHLRIPRLHRLDVRLGRIEMHVIHADGSG